MVRLFLSFMYGLPLIVGLWWLILFNRKSVKAQFKGSSADLDPSVSQKPRSPVPVAVLAWLYITAAAHIVILPFLPFAMPIILFGHIFPGRIGTLFYALNCLVIAVVGVSLLKLKPWAYHLTMGLNFFWLASGIGPALHANYFSQMTSIITDVNNSLHLPPSSYSTPDYFLQMRLTMYLVVLMPAAILGILFYYRKRFLEAASAATSSLSLSE